MILILAGVSQAQDAAAASQLPANAQRNENSPGRREITIWGGFPVGHPHMISDVVHDVKKQQLFMAGVHFDQRLWRTSKFDLRGNLGLIPLAIYSQTAISGSGRSHTYGGGFSAGFEIAPNVRWRVRPYASTDIGALIFTQGTPVPDSGKFNLTCAFGPGIRVALPGGRAIRAGVWLHHFSDAGTRDRNPGVDNFIFYVGYSFPGVGSKRHAS